MDFTKIAHDIPGEHREFIGRIADACEDFLTEHGREYGMEALPDVIFLGKAYDELAGRIWTALEMNGIQPGKTVPRTKTNAAKAAVSAGAIATAALAVAADAYGSVPEDAAAMLPEFLPKVSAVITAWILQEKE